MALRAVAREEGKVVPAGFGFGGVGLGVRTLGWVVGLGFRV